MTHSRRAFLKQGLACGLAMGTGPALVGQTAPTEDRLTLSAPLTHSDWMLKPNIPAWGEAGVRHMLDQCKACGWSIVHWRVFDAGRATYKSKLLRPMGRGEPD